MRAASSLKFASIIALICVALLWCCRTAYDDGRRNPARPWEYYASPPAPGWERNKAVFHLDEDEPTTRPTGTPTTAPVPRPPPRRETP
jgi:hypothetical protein